jgi:2-amino-4-hydroxy-6-hydroxymethyldihydropteridine diphosphokinase
VLLRLLEQSVVSALFRSEPQEDVNQPVFWNAAMVGHWSGTAFSLLERLLMLESRLGRERDPLRPKGPRRIDLDLLWFGDSLVKSSRLNLPHPGMMGREFVLRPLLELLPQWRHPEQDVTIIEAVGALGSQGVERCLESW